METLPQIGRPKIGPAFDFHLPEDTKERLRRASRRYGVPMSGIMREALDKYLNELEDAV
jgi:predicted DNA-binding protein